MSSTRPKALIIGGGIAGPVTALFLQRIGIEAEIYEARSQRESQIGSFLNLAGNGLDVLKTVGLDEAIAAAGSPVPRMVMKNGRGKRLGEVRNGARQGLTQSVTLRRGELQRVLHHAAQSEGIPLHFDCKLQQIEKNDAQGVVARFAGGTTAHGDILIGCDGVHSRTRQLLNPQAPQPAYTGLVSTGGFTFHPQLAPTPETQYFFFGRRAFFGYHVTASGEIYWFNNYERKQEPGRRELESVSSDEWRQRLLTLHRDDLPLIRAIIRSTERGIMGYPIYDIASQPIWHQGRVVLVGDAVHAASPSSGQGVSLAVEDAGMLAKCLRDIPQPERAFAAYEQLRRDRVEKIVQWGRNLGSQKAPANAFQAWMRDLLLPFFLRLAANPAKLDWIYAFSLKWETRMANPV